MPFRSGRPLGRRRCPHRRLPSTFGKGRDKRGDAETSGNSQAIEVAEIMFRTIAKLARAAGVGGGTVRYYQRRGLMPVPQTYGATYRAYDQAHVRQLLSIRRAQAAGF